MTITLKEDRARLALTKTHERGIYRACEANKCLFEGERLHIPLFDWDGSIFGYRTKDFAPDAQRKYFWRDGKAPKHHDLWQWYIPPTTVDAIEQAHGVAYLANGEPATLALLMSQLYNTFCTTLSEISIPGNTISVLERLGVRELRFLADNDRAGWDSAIKWRDALLGSDIEFKAYSWGQNLQSKVDVDKFDNEHHYMASDTVSKKYDANDLWIDSGFDVETMQAAVNDLERLILPQPEVKAPVTFVGEFDNDGLVAELQQALTNRFTGRKMGEWLQLTCIHHDDNHASAGFNMETGVMNCFTCGSHSPNESADVLGIDWRKYLPERPTPTPPNGAEQAKPKAAKPERPQAPKIVDTRDYTQRINDDIMARQMAYEAGQYVSWISNKQYDEKINSIRQLIQSGTLSPQNMKIKQAELEALCNKRSELPFSFLSALLCLSGASNLAPVFGKMHEALLSGRLKSFFTIAHVMKATKQRRAVVTKAMQIMLDWGFVRFLRTHSSIYIDSIDTNVSKLCEQNPDGGRPAQVFAIDSDSEIIRLCLNHMLSVHYEQKYFRRAISIPNPMMAQQIGIDSLADYETWKARAVSSKSDKDNKAAHEAYRKEMYGDGKGWRGWHYALQSRLTIPIDWSSINNTKDLRAFMAKWWIDNIRAINSRDELQRLLGCSDPVVDSTLAAIDYTSDKQYTELNFVGKDIPDTVKGMRSIFNDNQRQLRGKCFVISYKVKQDEDWKPAKWMQSSDRFNREHRQPQYLVDFATNIGKIEEIYMRIITPSMQRPMTEDELTARNEALENQELPEAVAVSDSQEIAQVEDDSDVEPVIAVVLEPSVKSKEYYEFKHLFNQVRLNVHVFTELKLATDGTLRNADDEIVKTDSELADILKYINSIASDSPLRTVASFYGNYDELADIAEIEAYAQARLERLNSTTKQEGTIPELVQVEKPKQIELPTPEPVAKVIDNKHISETERKRRETLALLQAPSRRAYLEQKVGA